MKDRLLDVLSQLDNGWIPPGMTESQLTNNAFCAWAAARTRSFLLGLKDDSVIADGLVGDAWSFQVSVPAHGGRVVWRQGEGSFDASLLAAGDLIGIFYTHSIYNADILTTEAVARWPLTYTHIVYVALTMANDALVIHDFRAPWTRGPRPWPVRIELLSRMRERFSGLFRAEDRSEAALIARERTHAVGAAPLTSCRSGGAHARPAAPRAGETAASGACPARQGSSYPRRGPWNPPRPPRGRLR